MQVHTDTRCGSVVANATTYYTSARRCEADPKAAWKRAYSHARELDTHSVEHDDQSGYGASAVLLDEIN